MIYTIPKGTLVHLLYLTQGTADDTVPLFIKPGQLYYAHPRRKVVTKYDWRTIDLLDISISFTSEFEKFLCYDCRAILFNEPTHEYDIAGFAAPMTSISDHVWAAQPRR